MSHSPLTQDTWRGRGIVFPSSEPHDPGKGQRAHSDELPEHALELAWPARVPGRPRARRSERAELEEQRAETLHHLGYIPASGVHRVRLVGAHADRLRILDDREGVGR